MYNRILTLEDSKDDTVFLWVQGKLVKALIFIDTFLGKEDKFL
jgi:hypothetical protein